MRWANGEINMRMLSRKRPNRHIKFICKQSNFHLHMLKQNFLLSSPSMLRVSDCVQFVGWADSLWALFGGGGYCLGCYSLVAAGRCGYPKLRVKRKCGQWSGAVDLVQCCEQGFINLEMNCQYMGETVSGDRFWQMKCFVIGIDSEMGG